MSGYTSATVDELYQWISSIDSNAFESKEDMLTHFDYFVSVAGLLVWRAVKSEHEYFRSRDDDKLTVTVVDTSGQRIDEFSTWCELDPTWFNAKRMMSTTPSFDPMLFRDEVKEMIQ